MRGHQSCSFVCNVELSSYYTNLKLLVNRTSRGFIVKQNWKCLSEFSRHCTRVPLFLFVYISIAFQLLFNCRSFGDTCYSSDSACLCSWQHSDVWHFELQQLINHSSETLPSASYILRSSIQFSRDSPINTWLSEGCVPFSHIQKTICMQNKEKMPCLFMQNKWTHRGQADSCSKSPPKLIHLHASESFIFCQ
jgi:hypothetical protein